MKRNKDEAGEKELDFNILSTAQDHLRTTTTTTTTKKQRKKKKKKKNG